MCIRDRNQTDDVRRPNLHPWIVEKRAVQVFQVGSIPIDHFGNHFGHLNGGVITDGFQGALEREPEAKPTDQYTPGNLLVQAGDAHAAQGDGECCVTAVETCAKITLKFSLLKGRNFAEPQLRTLGPLCGSTIIWSYYATTAQGPDLYANSQQAIRYMIDHLITERGLSLSLIHI